jgi:hypothetical protein
MSVRLLDFPARGAPPASLDGASGLPDDPRAFRERGRRAGEN